ncbi:hypothetical protein CEP51_008821 [Fusarium floridanum]|uniref:Uncharacterized protein n=1 Tax=Fusarium floridanum TaxID=1325733 RepID=A0A428RJM9_9HYPO|nr:hypothetical protein CEP51_008821 [Fusarium floridanum]
MGTNDSNIHGRFSQPLSLNQVNRVISKVVKGQTKKNLILRSIKELRRNRQTLSGPSTSRKTQNSARHLFYAGTKAITAAPVVDDSDNAVHATERQSHENAQYLLNTPVDDDQFHQLSTHESIVNDDHETIHDAASEHNMVGTLHHGNNGSLEFRRPRTFVSVDICSVADEIGSVTDDIYSVTEYNHDEARHETEPDQYDFSDEKRALEPWARLSSQWGDPSIGPDEIRQGFENHLSALKSMHGSDFFKVTTGYQSPTFVSQWNELAEALYHPRAREIAGDTAREVKDRFYHLANFLADSTKREEVLNRDVQQTRERIDARSAQLERFMALVRQLEAQSNAANAAHRREEIYRQVSQLIKVTGAEGFAAKARCEAKSELYRDLLHREKALVDAVQEEARAIGLGNHTPNELEWALEQMVAGDSLEYVEDALNSCF